MRHLSVERQLRKLGNRGEMSTRVSILTIAKIKGGTMKLRKSTERRLGLGSVLAVVALVALIIGNQPASAVDSGPTTTGDVCMQQVYGGDVVTNANRLVCTAQDIKVARALSVSPSSCVAGTTFDLTATFQVDVTANARYDAAFFFNITGGADARNPNGTCSESILTNPPPTNGHVLNLDGDSCGDLNAGSYTDITFTIPGVLCQDTDGDGFLNLPNCTSWHSNAGNVCNGPLTAAPETKSKCNCDDTFQVGVTVESPSGAVLKTATKAVVTYEVKVKNNSATRTVQINSLVDDQYGDITLVQGAVQTTNCADLIGDTLAPGATSDACQFTVKYDDPGTGGDVVDKVTAEIEDTVNHNKVNVEGTTAINVELNFTPPSSP
jgi:hypothetical protein